MVASHVPYVEMVLHHLVSLLSGFTLVAAWSTLVVPHSDSTDDTPTLLAALTNYTTNATILFEKGVTYNIFTPITFPKLTNVEISIQGNLTYPTDIAVVQGSYLLLVFSFL